MEWLMSIEEITYWLTQVSSSKNVLKALKQYLAKNNLYIGPATFTSGFVLVLHTVCSYGSVNLLQYVLDHHEGQFDINQLIFNYYPYHYAQPNEMTVSRKLAIHKDTLVHAAVDSYNYMKGSISTKYLMLLVSHGASVNIPDCCSVTPLIRAVRNSDKNAVRYLIQAGADVHYQDINSQTVMMHAIKEHAGKEILTMLLEAGVDSTVVDECGYTALHHAVSANNVSGLKVLLSFKISPNLLPNASKVHALFLADKSNIMRTSAVPPNLLPRSLLPSNPHIIADSITKHRLCPSYLKIDSMLLKATYLFFEYAYNSSVFADKITACQDQFKRALTLRNELQLAPPSVFTPIDQYGNLTEVVSVKEFVEKYCDSTNTSTHVQINLAFQCLIVRERCLGYGDSTVIKCLLTYGHWMMSINCYTEGLSLWVRATDMLISRLQEGITSDQDELKNLIKCAYKFCSMVALENNVLSRLIFYPNISSYTVELCHRNEMFASILRNLIECQRLSIELYISNKHIHTIFHGDHSATFASLIKILEHFFQNPAQGINVSVLCCEAIEKCPKVPAGSPLISNLLDLAITLFRPSVSVNFLSLLLESGGHIFVNEIGRDGFRPLQIAQTKEVTLLLLAYGAHHDAVSRPISHFKVNKNLHLEDYLSTPSPLTCLSARSIVQESIPYQLIHLPHHIIEFIALHDQADIGLTINETIPQYYYSLFMP